MALVPLLKINSVLPKICNEIKVVSEVLLQHTLEGVWGNAIESGGLVVDQLFDGANEICPIGRDVNLPHHFT